MDISYLAFDIIVLVLLLITLDFVFLKFPDKYCDFVLAKRCQILGTRFAQVHALQPYKGGVSGRSAPRYTGVFYCKLLCKLVQQPTFHSGAVGS